MKPHQKNKKLKNDMLQMDDKESEREAKLSVKEIDMFDENLKLRQEDNKIDPNNILEKSETEPCKSSLGLLLFKKIGEGSYSVVSETYWYEEHKNVERGATKLLFFDDELLKSGMADFFVNELFCSYCLVKRKNIFAFQNVENMYNHLRYGIHMKLYPLDLYSLIKFSIDNYLPLELVKYIMKQCTLALKRVHDAGIMHRDIKPENFMIEEDFSVELVDFSLSTFQKKSLNYKVVTLWWRPLDVLIRTFKYDNKIDIWSLGLVFLELIKGKKMFCSNNEKDIAISILTHFGFPSEKEWPELHECFPKIDKSGMKAIQSNIKYALPYETELRYEGVISLLDICLNTNPNQRASCENILNHPFLKDAPKTHEDFNQETKDWIFSYTKYKIEKHIEKKNSHSFNYSIKYPCKLKTQNKDVKKICTEDEKITVHDTLKIEDMEENMKKNMEKNMEKNMKENIEESNKKNTCNFCFIDDGAILCKQKEEMCFKVLNNCNQSFILPLFKKCKIKTLIKTDDMNLQNTRIFFLGFMFHGFTSKIQAGHLIILSLYISCVLTSDVYPTLYQICKLVDKEPLDKLFSDCVLSINDFLQECKCTPPNPNLLKYVSSNPFLHWIYD